MPLLAPPFTSRPCRTSDKLRRVFLPTLEAVQNFFKLNADKTTLLITCQLKYRRLVNDFTINANKFIIQQSKKIKILGVYYTAGLDNGPNVSNIIQKVTYRINTLKNIMK